MSAAGAQQRAERGAAVEVEQHELAAVRRQMDVERVDDRPRADREVDHRLEREDRAAARPGGRRARSRRSAAAARARSATTGARALTGNELYLNGLNSGTTPSHAALANAGNIAGQPTTPGEAREARDADHRRDQHEAIRPRQRLVVEGIERVLHRQRAAVGIADEMQRRRRARRAGALPAPRGASPPTQSSHSTSVSPLGTVP